MSGLSNKIGFWAIRKSIKTRLVLLLFGLTALSIAVVGYLGVRGLLDSGTKAEGITSSAMQQRSEQFLVQTANDTADKNGLVFKNIQLDADHAAYYATNLLNNPNNFPNSYWRFDDHMTRTSSGIYTNSTSEPSAVYFENYITMTPQLKREAEVLTYADYLMPKMLQNEPNAAAFYFLGTQGETVYYPNVSFGDTVPPDFNPTTLDFYTVADPERDPNRAVKWSQVYDDPVGQGLLITAAAPIYTKNNVFQGIIGMDITLTNIAKNIENYSPISSSYAFLIDNEGRAVALPAQGYKDILNRSPKKGEFGVSLQKVQGDFASVLTHMRAGQHGFQDITANKQQLLVAYSPVADTNFSLAIVAKRSAVLQAVSDLQKQVKSSTQHVLYLQILPFGIFVLVLVCLLGFIYIRFLTTPIIALTEQTKHVMEGDFSHGVTVTSSDEIGTLAVAFNKMIAELATSYESLRSKVKELRNGKAKDEAILESLGEGVIVADSHGRILLINSAAVELMNIPAAGAIGKQVSDYPIYDAAGQPLASEHRPIYQALKNGHKVRQDLQAIHKNGAKNSLSVMATPVRQNNITIGAVETIRDITKEREIDRMKTEFISVASHQLRTPLSAIKWFSEMLLKGEAGKLDKQQQDFTRSIVDSAARMNELIGSLLNISRLESGRMVVEPEPTDLGELVNSVVRDLKGQIEGHKQKLSISIDKTISTVSLDPRLIGQVYLNLLSNAIKYTPHGGKISLSVARDGKRIVSVVSDTGYGIPKAEQHKVFQKFYRGTNVVKVETDGTGLGMYFARAIVESSGGSIEFVSQENKGTTFRFTLPFKPAQEKAAPKAEPAAPKQDKPASSSTPDKPKI
ncbi:MAG TPA: ATP-binding protein [Candidatus Saccharimonadales bacterium]|nr:ATP-binding protein [Candidatus Saccharimonadales bacterium]